MKVSAKRILLTASLTVSGMGLLWPAMVVKQPYRSTVDGVYTKKQAERGERIHKKACLNCHLVDFYKDGLIDSWIGNTVGALKEHIANTMPEDRPSSLKRREYTDLMAFLLMINGFPAGAEELPSEDSALAQIVIERSEQ